ncbi:MAG: helix-turn-helix domain-containing protein [Clostridium sp.]|nr:helix-turn-helix domain-containing protein [Clostridium sp.]
MKFLKLSHDLIIDTNITSNEFRIYTYLLSLYNENKKCAYPSIETISNKLNISVATVKRSIKKLVELGYMIIEKKKGVAGNYNTYKELKHLIKNVANTTKRVVKNVVNKVVNERNLVIVSDCKESGVQLEIEELNPYSKEHQAKISLVLKNVKNLTEKQIFLIGDMDLETLRKAIFRFKKSTKTHTFAFLVECYYTECGINGLEPSMDLQRYTGNNFIAVSNEMREREEVKRAMIQDGIFDEKLWNENIALGL